MVNYGHENKYEQHLVFSVLKYIDTYYISATLEDFCRENHLKTYTVSRLLKKHTAKTFKELLKERKLQQAAYLLRNTTLSTEKIFHIIGYENSSFFHKIFREKYGKTPKEYRFQ
ncbi:MAG TPA: helix-turn-helix transcriptional regulator [Candidatus Mediterraneibacter intestinigallinarum]|nr:helix-turn-helix transcriptional regulator [Candidatus Mediterraneibacter intestinigallinarum]